jgi:hypothetical protein
MTQQDLTAIEELPTRYYAPSDSYEHYDPATHTFYNILGDMLRDPSEYNSNSEGYTPFGDE